MTLQHRATHASCTLPKLEPSFKLPQTSEGACRSNRNNALAGDSGHCLLGMRIKRKDATVLLVVIAAAQSFPQISERSFISHARIRVKSPTQGAVYDEHALVPVQIEIDLDGTQDYAVKEQQLWFRVEVDRAATEPLVLEANASLADAQRAVSAFGERYALAAQNRRYLLTRVEEARAQLRCPLTSTTCTDPSVAERLVCISVDGQKEVCTELSEARTLTVRAAPGRHGVSARLQGFPGRSILHTATSNFTLQHACRQLTRNGLAVYIKSPRHGQRVTTSTVGVRIEVQAHENHHKSVRDSVQLCIRLNTADGRLKGEQCDVVSASSPVLEGSLGDLTPGRHKVTVYTKEEADGTHMCPKTLEFEVVEQGQEHGHVSVHGDDVSSLMMVTAASQSYFDEKRLHNLIGSIHHWEPEVHIVFYDLGLTLESLEEVRTWVNVDIRSLRELPSLPSHVYEPQQYAFKPVVISDALERAPAGRIFWIDANAELRRPLNELREHMERDGYFLTVQPVDFPTPQYHHPECVRGLGCTAPDLSRQHCSTAFIGLVRDSWADTHVMQPARQCALEQTCINPPGSSRANHRQEQTVVNAILCRLNASNPCRPEKRWWLSSDFENDNHELQPTVDETDFNEVVFYTRRDFPVKPYVRHLRVRQGG